MSRARDALVLERAAVALAADDNFPERPDMNVPLYDRTKATGNWMVCWLAPDGLAFSARTTDFGHAMMLARAHKHAPAWVLHGTSTALDTAQLTLSYRDAPWLTPQHVEKQLRSVVDVKASMNQPRKSTFIQPKEVRDGAQNLRQGPEGRHGNDPRGPASSR